jgi:metal-responsive CopG/Arc/MetJ family transcriptional regulator
MNTAIAVNQKERMRTHVIMPEEVIKQLDKLVGARERSRFIVAAVVDRMNRIRLERAARKAAGSLANWDIDEWFTSEKASSWVHELRRAADRELEQPR